MTSAINSGPVTAVPVELRTTKANDICLALVGAILGPLELWGALGWVWSPDFDRTARDVRGGALLVGVRDTFGPAPLSIGIGLFGFWLLCTGIGGIWRLLDGRPAILASADGLHFHPSVCGRAVPWSEVRYIRDVEGAPAQIRIGLARRFWSPLAWITATSVRLNRMALGLSEREAREVVRQVKAFAPEQLGHARLPQQRKPVALGDRHV